MRRRFAARTCPDGRVATARRPLASLARHSLDLHFVSASRTDDPQIRARRIVDYLARHLAIDSLPTLSARNWPSSPWTRRWTCGVPELGHVS